MLRIKRAVHEAIVITLPDGREFEVVVSSARNNRAILSIDAPRDIVISRRLASTAEECSACLGYGSLYDHRTEKEKKCQKCKGLRYIESALTRKQKGNKS